MISLEQIQLLDQKVKKAVDLIDHLKKENSSLRGKLGEYEKRVSEMEQLFTQLRSDQEAIEEKIRHALSQLDRVEEEISGRRETAPSPTLDPPNPAMSPETDAEEGGPPPPSDHHAELDIF
jgi:chromosome segregation ATPase